MFNKRVKKERQKVLNLPISMKSREEKFKIIGKSKYSKLLWIFRFWISSFLHEKKVGRRNFRILYVPTWPD